MKECDGGPETPEKRRSTSNGSPKKMKKESPKKGSPKKGSLKKALPKKLPKKGSSKKCYPKSSRLATLVNPKPCLEPWVASSRFRAQGCGLYHEDSDFRV